MIEPIPDEALLDDLDDIDAAPPDAALPDAETPLGEFRVTYYWMAMEPEDSGERDVQLYTRECEPLAMVSRRFAVKMAREGTGRLQDGRTLNVAGMCNCEYSPCYFEVSARKKWGVGVARRPLSPFRSIAVDPSIVPIGTLLYIPQLDGLTMPGRQPWGGFVHDGCVVADDTGGNITGNQIDLFMARKPHYRSFYRRNRLDQVTVLDGQGRCEPSGTSVVGVHRNST